MNINKELIEKILDYYKNKDIEESNLINKIAIKESIAETAGKEVHGVELYRAQSKGLDNYKYIYDGQEIGLSLIRNGYIGVAKIISRVSGGSCYSDSNDDLVTTHYNINDFDFDILDSILEIVKPDIRYLEYRKLEKNLIKSEEITEHEYYGNNQTYLVKVINLKKLFELLNLDISLDLDIVSKNKKSI